LFPTLVNDLLTHEAALMRRLEKFAMAPPRTDSQISGRSSTRLRRLLQ